MTRLCLPAVAGALLWAAPAVAQSISFKTDLPRTLVFIQEDGRSQVASREMTAFLREAGFPVIDPALAHEAAQRELVRAAMEGDEGAATELGRDFGAQVLILGLADWGARPDPVDGTLITGTTEVSVRALRLDLGTVVSDGVADARVIEATEQAAKSKAVRQATQEILNGGMIGKLINDWEAEPWQEAGYWKPDPGSIQESTRPTEGGGDAPGLAIIRADVLPSQGTATRGIGVVKKGGAALSGVQNTVRLEGVVVGNAQNIQVDGAPAIIEPLPAELAARLGLQGANASRFFREFSLPISQDSVKVVAQGRSGSSTQAIAAPRIDRRLAVVIGVGQYASADIPDLEFAKADAQSVYDFLKSDAAGPFDDVLFLTDEQATGAAMRQALFVFLQQADWNDLVVVYYAGHGAPDPARPDNLYLLPSDADLNQLAATGFPMWDVKTALRRQIAAERVLVIADACHSAGTADGDVVGGGDANAIAGGFSQLFTPSRRLMMTAANTNEFSLEDARWGGHGVFTHFLLEGLEGKGDVDADGIVTFTELFDYVAGSVRTATDGRQNPQRSGFGDIPLAVVGGAGG
ncbi:MAG TPA: caspase family protein [Longimicrobiales bacterium]|nr:caspase family protein [Longimicrobiales bacterium]